MTEEREGSTRRQERRSWQQIEDKELFHFFCMDGVVHVNFQFYSTPKKLSLHKINIKK
jgi:hypothetical protein